MVDIWIEVFRSIAIAAILFAILRLSKRKEIGDIEGLKWVKYGFFLIFLGSIIDITDNFKFLSRFIIIGDTVIQALIEKVVGYLGGFSLLALGFHKWIPQIYERQQLLEKNLKSSMDAIKQLQEIQKLEQHNHYLNSLLDAIPIPIIEKKPDSTFSHVNMAFCEALGVPKSELLGKTAAEVLSDQALGDAQRTDQEIIQSGETLCYEQRIRFADGLIHDLNITKAAIHDSDGKLLSIVAAMHDVTERKIHEAKIRHLAMHDTLTNLPNRRMFYEQLKHLLSMGRRQNNSFALLFIDLDDFKPINDRLGHEAGDIVLKTVAQRISSILRSSDYTGRLGGDEFAVLLGSFNDLSGIETASMKILKTVRAPIIVKGQDCSVDASIGIAVFPQDADNLDDLINNADRAMYSAKELGKGSVKFFGENSSHDTA